MSADTQNVRDAHSSGFVGVHHSDKHGSLLYVLVDQRQAFDLIGLPVITETDKVIAKSMEQGIGPEAVRVIFQHWLHRADDAAGVA